MSAFPSLVEDDGAFNVMLTSEGTVRYSATEGSVQSLPLKLNKPYDISTGDAYVLIEDVDGNVVWDSREGIEGA